MAKPPGLRTAGAEEAGYETFLSLLRGRLVSARVGLNCESLYLGVLDGTHARQGRPISGPPDKSRGELLLLRPSGSAPMTGYLHD
jgi:hypothetical protein